MKRALLFLVLFAAPALADTNVQIIDTGIHGYHAELTPVLIRVQNPTSKPQTIHLSAVAAMNDELQGDSVSADVDLGGNEQRTLELPILGGWNSIQVEARLAGTPIGRDRVFSKRGSTEGLVILLCSEPKICETAQSQVLFSGTIEERADKNRGLRFEAMSDVRPDWWAYHSVSTIVVAMPTTQLSGSAKQTLEGFVRRGGRLVLLEQEAADDTLLAEYRRSKAKPEGERIGKGYLFRVPSLASDTLGEVFRSGMLQGILHGGGSGQQSSYAAWLVRQFGAKFYFPKLGSVLGWLLAYIVVIGAVNFAVLRRLRRLELGWITICLIALLFAAGFYLVGVPHRPQHFRLDQLAVYSMDSRSNTAAAEYQLRISTPERRKVGVSVADPAVFIRPFMYGGMDSSNSNIWSEMNSNRPRYNGAFDVRFGPPRELDLSLLKWSFEDLYMQGLRSFPGTVHLLGGDRLRNDTGQRFEQAVFLNYDAKQMYVLPAIEPGQEIALSEVRPQELLAQERYVVPEQQRTLAEFINAGGFLASGRFFVGVITGPELPVSLSVPHETAGRALVMVAMEQQP